MEFMIVKKKLYFWIVIFVLTSRFEGHPMGLIEALSYGLPSLVTTGTNMAKEIESNNAGWIAETEIESIVIAIKRLIREKVKSKKKGTVQ